MGEGDETQFPKAFNDQELEDMVHLILKNQGLKVHQDEDDRLVQTILKVKRFLIISL